MESLKVLVPEFIEEFIKNDKEVIIEMRKTKDGLYKIKIKEIV